MSELEVATAEATYVFSEGDVVTIGRRDDNKVILAEPTVSRQHAAIRFEAGGWVLEDLSGGRTFRAGQPIARLDLGESSETINLASPTGPWITISSGPVERTAGTELASVARSAEDTAGVPVVGATSAFTAGQSAGPPPAPGEWAPSRPGGPSAFPPQGAFGTAGPGTGAPASPRGSLNSEQIKRALHILFPYRSWIENAGWRSRTRLLFLVYAMLPVLFLVAFLNTTNFQTLGWVYAIYTAPVWLAAFWYLIKPEDTPRTLAITGAAVTVIVLLIMAGPLQWWYKAVPDPQNHPGNWFGWLLAPGIAEEATKDGAVLLTVLVAARYFKAQLGHQLGVRSCMFLGTIAGLAFGAREAALYQDKDLHRLRSHHRTARPRPVRARVQSPDLHRRAAARRVGGYRLLLHRARPELHTAAGAAHPVRLWLRRHHPRHERLVDRRVVMAVGRRCRCCGPCSSSDTRCSLHPSRLR